MTTADAATCFKMFAN